MAKYSEGMTEKNGGKGNRTGKSKNIEIEKKRKDESN